MGTDLIWWTLSLSFSSKQLLSATYCKYQVNVEYYRWDFEYFKTCKFVHGPLFDGMATKGIRSAGILCNCNGGDCTFRLLEGVYELPSMCKFALVSYGALNRKHKVMFHMWCHLGKPGLWRSKQYFIRQTFSICLY